MDLREARELLGVDAEDDAKAVRRAYLRRLKQHKPESDPEGFQRVREAFEVAKSCVGFRLGGRPGAPAAFGDAPPAPLDETMAATGLAAGRGLPTGEPTPPIDAGASEPAAPAGTALATERQPPQRRPAGDGAGGSRAWGSGSRPGCCDRGHPARPA